MSPSSTLGKAKVVADAKTVALITGSNRDIGFETARELGHANRYPADFTRMLQEEDH
jgi:hypothetical protein